MKTGAHPSTSLRATCDAPDLCSQLPGERAQEALHFDRILE
jgi:hypothetical protein